MSAATRQLGRALLAFLAVVFFAVGAAAEKRLVVAAIDGDGGKAMRAAVLQGLAGHDVRIVSLAHAEKVAAGLGTSLSTPKGIAAVSNALGLSIIVEGSVKKGSGVWTATVRVRSGKDGDVAETHKFRAADRDALAAKVKDAVWKQVQGALKDSAGASGKPEVAVQSFSGPKGSTVRSWVVSALRKDKGTSVISDKTLKQRGATLDAEAKPAEVAAAAELAGATAVVGGQVEIKGRKTRLMLSVRNAADGEVLSEVELEAGSMLALKGVIARNAAKKLSGPLARGAAKPPPEEAIPGAEGAASSGDDEEEDESESEDDEGDDEEDDVSDDDLPRQPALELLAGMRAFSRNYRYSDDLFDALRSYELGAAPAAMANLRWYPAAHFSRGGAANIGLYGSYETGFALKSKVSGGEELSTRMQEWQAGLRYRLPIDAHEVGFSLGYGSHSFEIEDDPAAPLVPDVNYTFIRAGVDARVLVSVIMLRAHLGHRFLLDTGELGSASWFPNASGGAVDAGFSVGYSIIDNLSLVAGFDFRRYYLSFDPQPGDPNIAGGASDEYLSGWGGLLVLLPGK